MNSIENRSFAVRLDRFVRWFFTASPTAVIEPSPRPALRVVGARKPTRLRAPHADPVRVAAKGKS